MKVTIREVAKAAKVSLGTASRALNGDPTVNPKHLTRVENAATELNYRRLRARSHIRSGAGTIEGRSVAVILLGMDRTLVTLPVIAEAVHGVEVALSKSGAQMTLIDIPDIDRMPASLRYAKLDGVIIKGALQGDAIGRSRGEVMTRLRQLPRIWLLGRPEGCDGDCVGSNDLRVGQLAADHLLEMGHRRVAFLNPKADHTVFSNRQMAFVARMNRAGIEVRTFLGPFSGTWSLPLHPVTDVQAVQQLVDDMLAVQPQITAVFCPGDSIAALIYRALSVRGKAAGKDMSIISVNNEKQLTQFLHPTLTTIDIHAEMLGDRCVEHLAWRLQHPTSSSFVEIGIEPTLVPAESVSRLSSAER
jgi:LacI family transcriptional regulator